MILEQKPRALNTKTKSEGKRATLLINTVDTQQIHTEWTSGRDTAAKDRNVQKSARPQKTEALGLAAPERPEEEARVEGRGGRTLGEEPDRARRQQSGLGFGTAGDLGALRSRLWPKSAPPLSGRTPGDSHLLREVP